MNYKGVLIEESLADKSLLGSLKTLETIVEPVEENDGTPWLKQWTMRTVEVPETEIEPFAVKVSKALDNAHSNWYADFKNEAWHYIIFSGKIFKVERKDPEQYEAVKRYGLSLGIPERQLDFSPDIIV
jgi:hypothetical protein